MAREKDADLNEIEFNILDSISREEIEANIGESKREDEKYNKCLRARAKTPEQLTVGLECVVQEAHGYQDLTSFTPRSEIVLGGRSNSYQGGHTYRTEIKVQSSTLVEKLEFNGWPFLEAGDMIRAYIFKGKREYERGLGLILPETIKEFDSFFSKDQLANVPFHWVFRDYQPVEQPSKIEKLRDGKVVATYHNS